MFVLTVVCFIGCTTKKYREITIKYGSIDSAFVDIAYMTDTIDDIIRHYPVAEKDYISSISNVCFEHITLHISFDTIEINEMGSYGKILVKSINGL